MTQAAAELLKSLLELPERDRLAIADELYESVGDLETRSNEPFDWTTFIDERAAAADRGEFAEGTAFEVIERARRKVQLQDPTRSPFDSLLRQKTSY